MQAIVPTYYRQFWRHVLFEFSGLGILEGRHGVAVSVNWREKNSIMFLDIKVPYWKLPWTKTPGLKPLLQPLGARLYVLRQYCPIICLFIPHIPNIPHVSLRLLFVWVFQSYLQLTLLSPYPDSHRGHSGCSYWVFAMRMYPTTIRRQVLMLLSYW